MQQVQPIEMARAKLAVWPHSLDMMFICKQLGAWRAQVELHRTLM